MENAVQNGNFKPKSIEPRRKKQKTETGISEPHSSQVNKNIPKNVGLPAFLSGVDYQHDLSLLIIMIAAREIKNGCKLDFKITCENPDGMKFDDIGFCYKFENYPWISVFIQAKYTSKQKEITWAKLNSEDSTNPYSIIKYLQSIIEYKKQQESKNKTQDRSMFVLCTNIELAENVAGSMVQFDNAIIQKYLDELSTQVWTFDKNKISNEREGLDLYNKIKNKITYTPMNNKQQQETESETNDKPSIALEKKNETDFIDKIFKIFMIASKTIVGDEITNKMLQLTTDLSITTFSLNLEGHITEFFTDQLKKWLFQWISSKNGRELSSGDVSLYLTYIELLAISLKCEMNLGIRNEFKKDAWVDEKIYSDLKNCLQETSGKAKCLECTDNPKLALSVICSFYKFNENKYLFMTANYFKEFKKDVMNVFYETDQPFMLAVDCTIGAFNPKDFTIDNKREFCHPKVMIVIKKKSDPKIKKS